MIGDLFNTKWVFILLIIAIILITGLIAYSELNFPIVAEDKCEEAGLDLFDYSSGSLFTGSSITCINKETKEIIKIR